METLQSQPHLMNIKEASQWASSYLNKTVTESNISYLIQYGRVRKVGENGTTQVFKQDLLEYYKSTQPVRMATWKEQLGNDLNWALSFEQYKESETTKHVHRLHPYKGKFIPQLVEYFLDDHVDDFKKQVYFQPGDIVLDPFCGSGTTLVQANELGMHAIGIDVSAFNTLISNIKVSRHNLPLIEKELQSITQALEAFCRDAKSCVSKFDAELTTTLQDFNSRHFPSPEFKYKVRQKQINERVYGQEKEQEILKLYYSLVKKHGIELRQQQNETFLDQWYVQPVRDEIDFMFAQVKKIKNVDAKKIISVILSRTIRSCRATTHADLATLKEPQLTVYYCGKHGKICKPLFSIVSWWKRYATDTMTRIRHFERLRTSTEQLCLAGDSRAINVVHEVEKRNMPLAQLAQKQKIKGIFSSPPYVGLIDYHEQHAYAYDLFGFTRRDELEIGPLYRGQGVEARKGYVQGISAVLRNCKRFLADDFSVFLVANDKWGLYPEIAKLSGLQIVEQFKRPVLNRTEKDKSAYSEIIFHMKGV